MKRIALAAAAALIAAAPAMLGAQDTKPDTKPAAKPAATASTDAPVPVEVFAELPFLDTPRLSPDGTHVAAKASIGGHQYLAVFPLFGDAKTDKPKVMAAGDTVDINWWRWVGNDWLAVGVGSTTTIYGEDYYITRMLGVRSDMTKSNRLDWQNSGLRADDLLWAARDGSPQILFSRQTGISTPEEQQPSVYAADLSTGRTRLVSRSYPDVWDWYADAAGQLRMGYRLNDGSGRAALLYRPGGSGSFATIATRKGRDGEDAIVVPTIFRSDGSAIGIDDQDGRDAAYELSLPDLKLGKKLYGLDDYDIDGIVASAAGDDIDGINVTDSFSHTVWLNPRLKQVQAEMDKALGARRGRIISWNADRTRFLVTVGTPSQAGALYYYDIATGTMQRYGWQNDTLKGRTLSPVKMIRYEARDGTKIEAVLTLPRHRKAEKLPVIVMPHGGPFARDDEEWDWWTQYLAQSGYAVIQPNYRGSSGYGTAFAKLGEGQWGLKMQDDLNDALDWTVKEGIADPRRACMVGASYGGYAAMRAAQRDGARYRCTISFAGVSDLAAIQKYDSQFLYGNTRKKWLRKQAPDFRAASPRLGAAEFSAPILLVHGKADKRVPVQQSRTMAAALKSAGKPYEYIELPLADHHFTRSEDRLAFLKAMKAFLDRYDPA